ncbi:hypothetical protein [Defluviimonas sp. SAOS-178_SWC]|uniref:hypothetical protein n=1 Tax=Defluviimonas sp. SAOS-178_SWC TaxID=3121287 RepID=UPI003221C053
MHRMILPALLLAAPGGAGAEECAELGLRSGYLSALFCAELDALVQGGVTARGVGDDSAAGPDAPGLPDWPDIAILQDAYRADPRKTLELIRRIKDAGGLSSD